MSRTYLYIRDYHSTQHISKQSIHHFYTMEATRLGETPYSFGVVLVLVACTVTCAIIILRWLDRQVPAIPSPQ